jgi:hypothetical protein
MDRPQLFSLSVVMIRHWLFLILYMVLSLEGGTSLAQSYGNSFNYTTRSFQGRGPLTVTCHLEVPQSLSVSTITVDVTCNAGPSPSDRNIELVCYLKNWSVADGTVAYRIPIQLVQGQTTVKHQLQVGLTNQATWAVDVFEDGREIVDRRKATRSGTSNYQYINVVQNGFDFFVASLIASNSDGSGESRNLAKFPTNTTVTGGRVALPNGMSFTTKFELTRVNEASEDWRFYFAYSAWLISPDAIAEINNKYPQVAEALRHYVAAGGMLIASDFESAASIRELDRLLYSENNPEDGRWSALGTAPQRWWSIGNIALEVAKEDAKAAAKPQKPPSEDMRLPGAAFDAILMAETLFNVKYAGYYEDANLITRAFGFKSLSVATITEPRDKLLASLESQKLLARKFLEGMVVVATQPISELSSAEINNIAGNAQSNIGWKLSRPDFDGQWFFQNMIMQVGKPPVWTFCVMVALFGAVLGPGLLYFTARMQRRSLMILLVPAASFVTTALVVAYGVLHEGFDTHVKVTSLTSFDGPSQTAFSWSRQNYFSAVPPREGIRFPRDAFIRKVHEENSRSVSTIDPRKGTRFDVIVTNDQRWVGSVLPRQHQQYLVGHPVDGSTIPLSMTRTSSGSLELKNLTDSKLPFVALRGPDKDYYFEADIAPGEVRQCTPESLEFVANKVAKLAVPLRPKVPDDLQTRNSLMTFGTPRYTWNFAGNATANDVILTGIAKYLSDRIDLEPYGFVTVVPNFKAVWTPLEGKQAEDLNIVAGVQPW